MRRRPALTLWLARLVLFIASRRIECRRDDAAEQETRVTAVNKKHILDEALAPGVRGSGKYGECPEPKENALCVAVRFRDPKPIVDNTFGVTLYDERLHELKVTTEDTSARAQAEMMISKKVIATSYTQRYDVIFPAKDNVPASNDDVFTEFAQPMLEECLACIKAVDMPCKSGAIFAYGATGSGKSYTMGFAGPAQHAKLSGKRNGLQPKKAEKPPDGVLQKSFEYIFKQLEGNTQSVYVNAYEIYMGKVRDLLTGENLEGRINSRVGYLTRMPFKRVMSAEDANTILETIQNNREVSHTDVNSESSRSHAIVHVYLSQKDLTTLALDAKSGKKIKEPPKGGIKKQKKSTFADKSAGEQFGLTLKDQTQIIFVDLAGNENAASNANEGQKKEGIEVNLALSSIQRCLSDMGGTKKKLCNTRDNMLSTMLEELFPTDNEKTQKTETENTNVRFLLRVLVMINPSGDSDMLKLTETTLRFANEIKQLKISGPKGQMMQESVDVAQINDYKEQIAMWKDRAMKLEDQINGSKEEIALWKGRAMELKTTLERKLTADNTMILTDRTVEKTEEEENLLDDHEKIIVRKIFGITLDDLMIDLKSALLAADEWLEN